MRIAPETSDGRFEEMAICFLGYFVAATAFYVFVARRAPFMHEPIDARTMPVRESEVIELFPRRISDIAA
jgi:hypothetical protein